MAGRHHRDGLLRHVDAGEDARGLGDARQALVEQLGIQVLEVQVDVVLVRAVAAPSLISIVIARLTTSRLARSLARARSAP